MQHDDPTAQRRECLDRSAKEARELAATARDAWRRLGETDFPDPELEAAALDSSRRRDRALSAIGRLVLEHLAAGGTVELLPLAVPAPEPPPPPPVVEPEPVRPLLPGLGAAVVALPPAPPPRPAPRPAQVTLSFEPTPPPQRTVPRAVLFAYDEPIETLTTREFQDLKKVMASFGAPNVVRTARAFDEAADRLLSVVASAETWVAFPSDVQRALVGYGAAYTRYLQEQAQGLPEVTEDVTPAFSQLTAFSRTHRPGFVFGLSRDQAPVKGTWLDDARHWWSKLGSVVGGAPPVALDPGPPADKATLNKERALQSLSSAVEDGLAEVIVAFTKDALDAGVATTDPRILRILAPHEELLKQEPRFRALRKAIRESVGARLDEEEDDEADWPHVGHTEGKRAVIVGGDPRREVLDRVRDTFRFAEVEWPYFDPKRVQAVSKQVRSGSVDVVIFLVDFVDHGSQNILAPACRDAGAAFALVPHGYGVSAIRQALERTLVPSEAK